MKVFKSIESYIFVNDLEHAIEFYEKLFNLKCSMKVNYAQR